MSEAPVVLVTMPWATLSQPSLQLGLLHGALRAAGMASRVMHLNLELLAFLDALPPEDKVEFGLLDYFPRTGYTALSDYIFFTPPLATSAHATELAAFEDYIRPTADSGVAYRREHALAVALRRRIPAFLDHAARQVLSSAPAAVGFSCTFNQLVPSLALSRRIKEIEPGVKIVLGGANLAGVRGETLIGLCDWIDVVARGDGERVAPAVFRSLIQGRVPDPAPGLCARDGGSVRITPEDGGCRVPMAETPLPAFGDYFERLERSPLAAHAERVVSLPLESSRGCWWGEKAKCRFCGVDQELLAFDRKPVARIIAEMRALARDHQLLEFFLVDPCAEPAAVAAVFGALHEEGIDARAWFQTKADLDHETIRTLARVGLRRVFIGLESLSTKALKLMGKGTTALQGVRCLKWGAHNGIQMIWNFLYGFPGEDPVEYDALAVRVPALHHLQPPADVARVSLARSSEYFDRAEEYGIESLGPANRAMGFIARGLGASEAQVWDLAGYFEHRLRGAPDPDLYAARCVEAMKDWQRKAGDAAGRLVLHRGPGFVRVLDGRDSRRRSHLFEGVEAHLYLACADGGSPRRLHAGLPPEFRDATDPDAIRAFLDRAVNDDLMFRDHGQYLALALPY